MTNWTLPNFLTCLRFILVTVFALLFMSQSYSAALFLLGLAGLTDFLDGLIARRFNMRSRLGSMLDPLADKYLMMVSYLLLSEAGIIPWELTALIIGRDFAILSGAGILRLWKIRLYYQPTLMSKIATTCQIFVLLIGMGLFLALKGVISLPFLDHLFLIAMGAACVTTVTTCFQYGLLGYRFWRYGERLEK